MDHLAALFAGSAGLYTASVPPTLIARNTADSVGYVLLYFPGPGLGANTAGIASIDLKLFASTTISITATNNPITMTLTSAAVGDKRVTVAVPFTASPQGAVYVWIVPSGLTQGLYWSGADVRKL